MKYIAVLFVVAALSLAGCSDPSVLDTSAAAPQSGTTPDVPEGICPTTTWTLTAGQHIPVGTVSVTNDMSNLYVTYTLTYQDPGCVDEVVDAEFGTLHVWVGNSLLNVPANPQGIPVPGQFCQADGGACYDATGLTTYTFTIPFSELSIADVKNACPLNLYVVTHAEVTLKDCNGNPVGDPETAFGGDQTGSGNRWWFYGVYAVCCDDGPPPVDWCQTAFAKGAYVWTTDKKSNPENLPSLNLTKNRWGWAIKLTQTGATEYDIWAGAGLNKTSNGVLVGTLTINWDGALATVTYNMHSGYCLEEIHLWASDESPNTIAPGQYGNLAEFDPNATTYSITVPVVDELGDGVWFVAHAVACYGCQ